MWRCFAWLRRQTLRKCSIRLCQAPRQVLIELDAIQWIFCRPRHEASHKFAQDDLPLPGRHALELVDCPSNPLALSRSEQGHDTPRIRLIETGDEHGGLAESGAVVGHAAGTHGMLLRLG